MLLSINSNSSYSFYFNTKLYLQITLGPNRNEKIMQTQSLDIPSPINNILLRLIVSCDVIINMSLDAIPMIKWSKG